MDLLCWARYVSICSIYFAKKVAIDFCRCFSQLLRILFSLNLENKKWGSPCSFKRKRAFISQSSLVWGKSLTFCTRARSFARANDTKIVRGAKLGNHLNTISIAYFQHTHLFTEKFSWTTTFYSGIFRMPVIFCRWTLNCVTWSI